MPFPVCPSTKTSILCSKGLKMRVLNGKSAQKCRFCARGWLPRAQHYPPRALRGAFGSSALGNRLPQPTPVQPSAGHTTVSKQPRNLPPCMLPGTAPCIPPWNYRKKLLPCAAAGTPVATQPAAKTYPPAYYRAYRRPTYRRVLPPGNYRRYAYLPGLTTLLWVPRPAGG